MQEKALYVIAEFDRETQNRLAGYYDILFQNGIVGTQTKNIAYHFTLGSRSVDREAQLADDFDRICASTACIDIWLSHIGLFGTNVLFVGPSMDFEVLKLQQSFFPDSGNGVNRWVAHATLLIDEPETILKAVAILAKSFKPFKARIENIGLYEFFPARFIKSNALNHA